MVFHNRIICESSLRWILHLRRDIKFHNYNLHLIKDNDDGHSVHSMLWSIEQSKKIDKVGLYDWIKHDEGALGYSYYLDKNNMFKTPLS